MGASKVVTNVASRPKPPNAGKGRPKGVPNKSTAKVKEALALAFEGIGGVKTLKSWAMDNPTEFFKLWAKMLPQEISGPDGEPIKVTGKIVWGTEDRILPWPRAAARYPMPARSPPPLEGTGAPEWPGHGPAVIYCRQPTTTQLTPCPVPCAPTCSRRPSRC